MLTEDGILIDSHDYFDYEGNSCKCKLCPEGKGIVGYKFRKSHLRWMHWEELHLTKPMPIELKGGPRINPFGKEKKKVLKKALAEFYNNMPGATIELKV